MAAIDRTDLHHASRIIGACLLESKHHDERRCGLKGDVMFSMQVRLFLESIVHLRLAAARDSAATVHVQQQCGRAPLLTLLSSFEAFIRRCRAATPNSRDMVQVYHEQKRWLAARARPTTGERALSCRSKEHAPNETHGRSCFKSKSVDEEGFVLAISGSCRCQEGRRRGEASAELISSPSVCSCVGCVSLADKDHASQGKDRHCCHRCSLCFFFSFSFSFVRRMLFRAVNTTDTSLTR